MGGFILLVIQLACLLIPIIIVVVSIRDVRRYIRLRSALPSENHPFPWLAGLVLLVVAIFLFLMVLGFLMIYLDSHP